MHGRGTPAHQASFLEGRITRSQRPRPGGRAPSAATPICVSYRRGTPFLMGKVPLSTFSYLILHRFLWARYPCTSRQDHSQSATTPGRLHSGGANGLALEALVSPAAGPSLSFSTQHTTKNAPRQSAATPICFKMNISIYFTPSLSPGRQGHSKSATTPRRSRFLFALHYTSLFTLQGCLTYKKPHPPRTLP